MTEPAITVVLAVDDLRTATGAIDALRRQTVAERIELVLVGPELTSEEPAIDGLGAVTLVDRPLHPLSAARAAGIRRARGRVVYIAETHGFPRPDCLERLMEELRRGAGAVMPRLVNANPGTARSWASLFATYGAFTGSEPKRLTTVALHNGAFDRRLLAEIAIEPADLVYGVGVSAALLERNAEMRFCPEAVVEHLNVVTLRGIVRDRLVGGRLWAAMRSRRWTPLRRLAHACVAPLAPVVMVGRIARSGGWRGAGSELPRWTALLLVVYAVAQSCGELAGYVRGAGDAERDHLELEIHRERFV